MGDARFEVHLREVRSASDPKRGAGRLDDTQVVSALAAASRGSDPYLANVLATELHNRLHLIGAIMRGLADGVLVTDELGRIKFMNQAAERMLGWRLPEVAGLGVVLFAARPDRGASLTQLIRRRAPFTGQTWLTRSDGSPLPVEATLEPVGGDDERSVGVVVTFRDARGHLLQEVHDHSILAREREARERAERSEGRARLMAAILRALSQGPDVASRCERFVSTLVPMLGEASAVYVFDDAEELRLAKHVGVAPPQVPLPAVLNAVRSGSAASVAAAEVFGAPAPGGLRHAVVAPLAGFRTVGALVVARLAPPQPGDVDFLVSIARQAARSIETAILRGREAAARKGGEAAVRALNEVLIALRRSEERYSALMGGLSGYVFLTDAQGRLVDPPEFWCTLTGQSPEEAAGEGWVDAVAVADRDRVRATWREAVLAKRPLDTEFEIVARTGERFRCSVHAMPVEGETDRGQPWVALFGVLPSSPPAGATRAS